MGSMDVDLDGLSEDEMGVPPNTVSPAAAFIAGNAAGGAVWPAPVVSSLPLAPAPAMAPRQCQICLQTFTDPALMNHKDIYCKVHKASVEQCRRLSSKQGLLAEFDELYKAKPKTDDIRSRFAAMILKYETICPPQSSRRPRGEDFKVTSMLLAVSQKLGIELRESHELMTMSAWMALAKKPKGGGYNVEGAKAKWIEHESNPAYLRDNLGVEFGKAGA